MLGITGRPESKDGKTLEPMVGHGIQAISIGFSSTSTRHGLARPDGDAGLEQLLKDTRWRDIDYLVVDMPGHRDIQLTLAQKVPVTGAVIVTTPRTSPSSTPARDSRCSRRSASRSSAWSRT